MALENLVGADKFIGNLVPSNPTSGDDKREGDDHIRGIKNALKNTFPNLTGAVPLTQDEMGSVTGKVNKAGDTMSGALKFSTGGTVGAEVSAGGDWLAFGIGAATPAERVRINAVGVGIGRVAGTYALEVNGAVTAMAGTLTAFMATGGGNSADFGSLSNHPVRLIANGAEKVRVDTNGSVFIGTGESFPGAGRRQLEIDGPSTSLIGLKAGGANRGYFYADATQLQVGSDAGIPLTMLVAGIERLKLSTNGAVTVNGGADLQAFNSRQAQGSGWLGLPWGITIIWGSLSKAANAVTPVTFPGGGFVSTCWCVQITDSGGGVAYVQRATSLTKTGFTISNDTWNAGANGTVTVWYFAIGN